MTLWAIPLVVSFLSGLVFVHAVRSLAWKVGWIAQPKTDRWHQRPTALMGGLAIWGAVACGMAMTVLAGFCRVEWSVLLAASSLCALGALDDRIHIKPATKLVAQLVAASLVISFGYHTRLFAEPVLNLAASFFWIIAITNAVNLLDNMDGLAAGVVLIAAGYLGFIHADVAEPVATALAFSLVGALAAFLVFNFNPASIFMGDSGSMLIGFLLAVLSLSTAEASNVLSFVAVPTVILLVPILDTMLVTVTRILRGQSIAQGGRDHTSHRLVRLGLSEREAVSALWFLALVAGASASITRRYSLALGLGILPLIIVGFALIGIYLSRIALVDEKGGTSDVATPSKYAHFMFDFSYKRRVLEVLLDFVLVIACYYIAYGLRFEFEFSAFAEHRFYQSLPIVVAASLLAFFHQGVYRGAWSQAGTADLPKYVSAAVLATLLGLASTTVAFRFEHLSRSVFVIYGLLLLFALGATRLSFRLMDEAVDRRRPGRPTLVVGAGGAGEAVVRELLGNDALGLRVVGFVDDDQLVQGRRIHGYPVLGGTADLEAVYRRIGFEEIVVSTAKVSPETLERVKGFTDSRSIALRFFRIELAAREAKSAIMEKEWGAAAS
jgi:UDP-GlcNAc:undecaprenyl-phosphate GlcNAc-1-phosphate transferase